MKDRQYYDLARFGSFFGIFVVLISLFKRDSVDYELEKVELSLFIVTIIICTLLITNSIWPRIFNKYKNSFFLFSLTYCLIFLPIVIFIMSKGSVDSQIIVGSSLILLTVFLNWIEAIFVTFIGLFGGIIFYKLILTPSISITVLPLSSVNNSIFQILFFLLVSFIFLRRHNKRTSILNSKSKFLELIKTKSISSAHRSMTLQSREEDQFNHFIALPSAKEKIKEIIQNYRGEINESDLREDLLQLSESIESEERTKIYQVLSAKKYNLSELSFKCEEVIKVAGCDDVSINIFTKQSSIRCDEASILKMVYKISNDFYKKIYFENSGDDTDLVLSFFDTKILYESDEENGVQKLFSRTIDGVAIVISEKDINKENKIVKNLYTKKLTDLEAISESSAEDINFIDIEKGIDAHYGILENHSDRDYLTWVCVIPTDVYEIRPETLDMTEPINVKYNWPAAVELEKKFVNELKKLEHLNMSKIEYAVSLIKKYHFHQTRKSGEPYYMHPINVALIVLDIIKDRNIDIFIELNKNKEDLIIAALLHDILEDTAYSRRALTRNFGPKVRDLVLSVTKIDHTNRAAMLSNKQAFQDLIDKDPLSLCIKLADRLHNIITIDGHPKEEKRKAVAQETLDFFVPPAEKYGLKKLAGELKNMSEYILKNGKLEGWG